jgi:hypothetical protein
MRLGIREAWPRWVFDPASSQGGRRIQLDGPDLLVLLVGLAGGNKPVVACPAQAQVKA